MHRPPIFLGSSFSMVVMLPSPLLFNSLQNLLSLRLLSVFQYSIVYILCALGASNIALIGMGCKSGIRLFLRRFMFRQQSHLKIPCERVNSVLSASLSLYGDGRPYPSQLPLVIFSHTHNSNRHHIVTAVPTSTGTVHIATH